MKLVVVDGFVGYGDLGVSEDLWFLARVFFYHELDFGPWRFFGGAVVLARARLGVTEIG